MMRIDRLCKGSPGIKRCLYFARRNTGGALEIAALEEKIIQHVILEVLIAICEVDVVGFSYGFRRCLDRR